MPALLLVVLVCGGSIALGYGVARYSLGRANMKPSHRGMALGAVSGLAVLLLYFTLKQFGINLFRGNANHVFQAVLVVAFLGIPLRMLVLRRRSGPELADLGPSPLRFMFLGIGGLMLVMGAANLITRSLPVGQAIVSLAQGICFLSLGSVHTRFRSGGICQGDGVLRWERIARYEWKSGPVLLIELNRPRWWQDRVQLRVPEKLVPRVEELLREYVQAA